MCCVSEGVGGPSVGTGGVMVTGTVEMVLGISIYVSRREINYSKSYKEG